MRVSVRVSEYLRGQPLLLSPLQLLLTQNNSRGCLNGLLSGLLSRTPAHEGEVTFPHHNLTGVSERQRHMMFMLRPFLTERDAKK